MNMFATFASALLSLASLTLGESTMIGPFEVRRSSLFGYQVAGRVLDVDEAAHVLAHAAAAAQRAPHADLLRGPVESFPGSGRWSETWKAGHAADRRYEALRRALGGRYVTRSTSEATGFKTIPDAATVLLRYSVPRGFTVPAIERAS